MKKTCFLIPLFLCFILASNTAVAQVSIMEDFNEMREQIVEKQKNTRAEIEQLNSQIAKFEQRFQQADQKYEALFNEYKNLKHLIALQEQKLSKLQKEQSHIGEEIAITTQSLEEKRRELERLITNYKKTLGYLYKHGRTSQLALIFSSSSINQMLVRAFYLQKFNSYREKQAEDIRAAEQELKQTKEQLEEAKVKNEDVLAEITSQKEELAQKEERQERNVALLRENRDEIKTKLQEVQEQKQKLNNTLSDLIAREEEIRKAREQKLLELERQRKEKLAAAKKIEDDTKRSREVAKYSEPIKMADFMNAETMKEVEQQFAQNKGALPWPVESRTISEHFGNRRHPVYGTVTPNLGIEIVTDPQSQVHVVHDGYVIDVRPIPSYGDVVVVKHGRFFTAYGNLSDIMVRKNEVLDKGDILGLSGTSSSPKGESLFFLIRENNNNLDPESWLQMETVSSKY